MRNSKCSLKMDRYKKPLGENPEQISFLKVNTPLTVADVLEG